jgi:glycosyltransferase involved in cell wall biosynthesis
MDVSVIVPTYNRAELISQMLDSILAQTHKAAEVIVVDDGSTDDTEAVVRRYAPAVRYMRIPNCGECAARNVGAGSARTSWLAFCDSEDLWHRDKVKLQVELFGSAPDVQYSFTNFCTVVYGTWSRETKVDTSPRGYWCLPQRKLGFFRPL